MNVVFKVYWNNPIEMTAEAGTQQLTFEVPLGAIISNPHNVTTTYISEGTKLFFTEDRVRQTVLTGLDTSTATPALATDQLLPAIGKLQAQINDGSLADDAFSGLAAATNLTKTDLLGITQDVGGGAFTSKSIQAQHVAKAPEQEGSVTNPALLIANGTIQTLTLGVNGTLSTDLASGQSMTVLIPATSYTLDTSAFTVVNDFTLSTANLNVLVLFKVGSTSYLVGVNK